MSGYPGFHGNAGGCSDRRTPQSAVQDHPVKSSAPVVFGSLASGAIWADVTHSTLAIPQIGRIMP